MDRCGIRESKTLDNVGRAKFDRELGHWHDERNQILN
jgi:hypothetical protein